MDGVEKLNREEFLQLIVQRTGYEYPLVQQIVDAFIDNIQQELQANRHVELRQDFGTFVIREKGVQSSISMQRIVSFKATATWKKMLRKQQ